MTTVWLLIEMGDDYSFQAARAFNSRINAKQAYDGLVSWRKEYAKLEEVEVE